jgi:hypothetical protein
LADSQGEDYAYHMKVKTWFGFTYADIYIGQDSGSGDIERNIF